MTRLGFSGGRVSHLELRNAPQSTYSYLYNSCLWYRADWKRGDAKKTRQSQEGAMGRRLH